VNRDIGREIIENIQICRGIAVMALGPLAASKLRTALGISDKAVTKLGV
jgi:hypothetical protein